MNVTNKLAKRLGLPQSLLERVLTNVPRQYHRVKIPKRSGDMRRLDVPSADLKLVQRTILDRVLSRLPLHDSSFCRKRRSVIKNAEVHIGKKFVAAFDVLDCFGSTDLTMVRRVFRNTGVANELVVPITRLCTLHGSLPQGAPTSPAIVNGLFYPVDDALAEAATRSGLKFTRYMDDLFVSGNRKFPTFERLLFTKVKHLGYTIAAEKTMRWLPPRKATLAGVFLSTKPMVTQDYARSLERLLVEVGKKPVDRETHDRLVGKIGWIGQMQPRKAKRLLKLLEGAV